MQKPTVEPEQIASDMYYFATSKCMKSKLIRSRVRILHNMSDVGEVHPSQRWYRIWDKTEDGWKFVGLQFGRQPIVN
ncbi:MAG: hypothetical protein RLZZ176_404 [Cyanobacteriota bacterium]|jgi:hypothetical protein